MRSDSFYAAIGGHETFVRLVDEFYRGVADDPVLRPMYPEQDLGPAAERLTLFLEQYWGGPTTYSDERGHPRLRMRHAPFKVNPDARDRWLAAHARRRRQPRPGPDAPGASSGTTWSGPRTRCSTRSTTEPTDVTPSRRPVGRCAS